MAYAFATYPKFRKRRLQETDHPLGVAYIEVSVFEPDSHEHLPCGLSALRLARMIVGRRGSRIAPTRVYKKLHTEVAVLRISIRGLSVNVCIVGKPEVRAEQRVVQEG
jgi:hypothetical protein